MKKYMIIAVVALLCASLVGGLLLFVPPIQSKAETMFRLIEAQIRNLNPPDPYVSAPNVDIDPEALLAERAESEPKASPTATMTDTARPTATPSPTLAPPPPSASLSSVHQEYQTWNNCGPATVTMLLRTLGYDALQAEIAPDLKPRSDDKNVNPWEIESFLNQYQDLNGVYRMNGDMNMLKRFLAAGYPVIVEVWFEREPNDGMGHYRILRGYDDESGHFVANDSYEGSNQVFSYGQFDADWQVFNRTYIVAYTDEQESEVRRIVGTQWDDQEMIKEAEERAKEEIEADEDNAYAWFNLGTVLSMQNEHENAATAFDNARRIGLPWRMLWYQFAIFDSYLAVGRYDDVIELTNTNLEQSDDLEESYYYKGRALEAQGKIEAARSSYEQAVRNNPQYTEAQEALDAL
jgi:tetratricopeptide (TPR) repeat protein